MSPWRTAKLTSLSAWTPPKPRLTRSISSCSAPRSRELPLRLWRYARDTISSLPPGSGNLPASPGHGRGAEWLAARTVRVGEPGDRGLLPDPGLVAVTDPRRERGLQPRPLRVGERHVVVALGCQPWIELSLRDLDFSHAELLHLAGHGEGELIDEAHVPRDLEARDPAGAELAQ